MAIAVAQEVQGQDPNFSTNGTTIASGAITVSAGSILHVFAFANGASGLTASVSDGTNTYTPIGSIFESGKLFHWYALAVAAGTYTVTVTFGATVNLKGVLVREITGGNAFQTNAEAAVASPGTGTDAISSGSMTPTGQPALVSGLTVDSFFGSTPVAGTGYTTLGNVWAWGDPQGYGRAEHQRITSTAGIAATWTTANATDKFAVAAAIFTETVSAGSSVPSRRQQAPLADDDQPPARQRRSALIQQAPVISVVPPFRRQRALAQEEDVPPQAPRRFVPQVAAVVASFVPFRRQPPQVDPDPTFVWMGARSAQIQMPSGDPPPVGWPRRLLSMLSWTEPDPPPPARRFAPIPTVAVPPDSPPIGWPRRLLSLLQPQDPDALATRRLLAPPQSPPPAPPPVRSRRLFDTYRDAWDEPPLPIVRRPTVVTSGPVPPTPPPAPGSIYDWNADDAAIIGQMFRGGGFPFQIPKVG